MSTAEITISIGTESDPVSAKAFVDSLRWTLAILNDIAANMEERRTPTVGWDLGELRLSSPALTTFKARRSELRPNLGSKVADAFIVGIETLNSGERMPEWFSDKALDATKSLARVSKHNGGSLRIVYSDQSVGLSAEVPQFIDEIIGASFVSTGSVEGKLATAALWQRQYVRIYDSIHENGVICHFEDDQIDNVRQGLGKRVIASGRLRSDRYGQPKELKITDIDVIEPMDDPVKPSELRGLLKGVTGGKLAEDYLRELRGYDDD